MTAVDLPEIPPGTVMQFRAVDWWPQPRRHAEHDVTVVVYAVYRQEFNGRVWVRGHVCSWDDPDCGTSGCWQHQVRTAAVREHLA
ncbi:hypothetical protein AB0B63_07025 [Micromonospora sp. NPDC049081]|uniref:hypothetical protein n=1 Tax=Micromonospora sp. NPDC049081 TaxID=3155150 RepID=UPI0033E8BFFB